MHVKGWFSGGGVKFRTNWLLQISVLVSYTCSISRHSRKY